MTEPDEIKKAFGKRFREACLDSGLKDTQEDLAKAFSVSGVTIWSYRNGDKIPRMAKAIQIAQTLGVSIEWLLTGQGDKAVAKSNGHEGGGALSAIYHKDKLAPAERVLLAKYRLLSPSNQKLAMQLMDSLPKPHGS